MRRIKEDDKVAIYLATDSEEVKREMKERYGDRIFCSGKKGRPWIFGGNKGGYHGYVHIGPYTKIYGSFQSSFSDMAAQIGGTPLRF